MRNMSFSATTDQIRNGTKTVTRRLGWTFLKPGDEVMACVKCQGLKKGERVEKIRPLRIVKITKEPLKAITFSDLKKEGFDPMGRLQFIWMFCQMNDCSPMTLVTRIEFEYISDQIHPKQPLFLF